MFIANPKGFTSNFLSDYGDYRTNFPAFSLFFSFDLSYTNITCTPFKYGHSLLDLEEALKGHLE